MFGDNGFYLLIRREAPRARRYQAAIDAGTLSGRRMIFAFVNPLIDFERNLGQHVLRMFAPSFYALKCFFEHFRCHSDNISNAAPACQSAGTPR